MKIINLMEEAKKVSFFWNFHLVQRLECIKKKGNNKNIKINKCWFNIDTYDQGHLKSQKQAKYKKISLITKVYFLNRFLPLPAPFCSFSFSVLYPLCNETYELTTSIYNIIQMKKIIFQIESFLS